MERLVHFTLFGQEFSFYTDASEADIKQILEILRDEFEEDGDHGVRTSVPSTKMFVLGCLRVAARYVQLKREFDCFRDKQDECIDKLIHKVSSRID